ncbi:MAG: RNA 2'-phosphotransferase [Candidatus Obscuribacterales bacterium]|nr:RNA 2'-phosphotransferase [Candidatus Obscuribacterales bacterium]
MTRESRIKLSKHLSLVLRHRPDLADVFPDNAGWVDVESLLAGLARTGTHLDRDELELIVTESDKQRFKLNEDKSKIRANQGHSYQIDLGYAPQKPPELLFHGTASKYLRSIRAEGLIKRLRHHVHLASNLETAAKVGKRHGELVLLTIRSGQMFDKGYEFFLSDNGVWLTESVPAEFIQFPSNALDD